MAPSGPNPMAWDIHDDESSAQTITDVQHQPCTSPHDGEVFAVIHPRAVALHRAKPEGSPRNVWRGRASALDFQGDRVRVRVDGEMPIIAEVTPASVRELDLAEGGEVWVSVKATEITVYPA